MARKTEADALWSIVGYMLSGLIFWGGAGYFADKYFKTGYLTMVGLILGMGGALYLIWLRFGRE